MGLMRWSKPARQQCSKKMFLEERETGVFYSIFAGVQKNTLGDPLTTFTNTFSLMSIQIRALVPMVHVADVERSIEFYKQVGFQVGNTHTAPGYNRLTWAWLGNGACDLMVTQADGPVDAGQQAVLFYLYCDDVAATRNQMMERGIACGQISKPFYAPNGEFRIADPDGYVLMVMHT